MEINLEYVAQLVGYISVIGGAAWALLKYTKQLYNWICVQINTINNIQTSLTKIDLDVGILKKELQHNGGSSLKDYVSRLETELIKQEKRQKALIQDLVYGTFETDSTGKVVYVNRTYCRITGRTPDELVGTGWINCISSESREDINEKWLDTISENRELHETFSFILPTGGVIEILFSATPMFNTKNVLIGYFGTVSPLP